MWRLSAAGAMKFVRHWQPSWTLPRRLPNWKVPSALAPCRPHLLRVEGAGGVAEAVDGVAATPSLAKEAVLQWAWAQALVVDAWHVRKSRAVVVPWVLVLRRLWRRSLH